MAKFMITGKGGNPPLVDMTPGEDDALVVATRDLKTYDDLLRPFTNATYGVDMNQDPSYGGSPRLIYDEDTGPAAEWTTSAVTGTWTFDSTTQAYSGSKSIDATATVNEETMSLTSTSFDLSPYTTLTGHIYLTAWSTLGTKGVNIYGWDGGLVGNSVDIGDYINTTELGIWQAFGIPLSAMGLTNSTIDSIRFTTVDIGPGLPPDYYLDRLDLQEIGGPIEYTMTPVEETWVYVDSIEVIMADAYAGVVDTGEANHYPTMPGLSYDQLLGEGPLASGILYQRINAGGIEFSATIKQLSDMLQYPYSRLINTVSDGTNTMIAIHMGFGEPAILKAEDEDRLRIVIQDDLTGLLLLRMTAGGRVEHR